VKEMNALSGLHICWRLSVKLFLVFPKKC